MLKLFSKKTKKKKKKKKKKNTLLYRNCMGQCCENLWPNPLHCIVAINMIKLHRSDHFLALSLILESIFENKIQNPETEKTNGYWLNMVNLIKIFSFKIKRQAKPSFELMSQGQ